MAHHFHGKNITDIFLQNIQELRAQLNISQKSQMNNTGNKEQNIIDFFTKYNEEKLEGEDNMSTVVLIITMYSLLILVSFFGNCLVCKIFFGKSRTKSTINFFIGNISISDLIMTSINIPLQLTEMLARNWPLGTALCKSLHFIASWSVCVSTLTMAFIAIDRFQFIVYPLKPRPTTRSTMHKVLLIWIIAGLLSFPYAWMSEVGKVEVFIPRIRCRINYPYPDRESRKIFALVSLFANFTIPLSVTFITYLKILLIIWHRQTIGLTTQTQEKHRRVAKWKTIKMLILVLISFMVSWSPLMILHTYQDIRGEAIRHNSTVWLVCHWVAMSSSCYNPFIYCWLNEKFQKAAKDQFRCFAAIKKKRSQKPSVPLLPQSRNKDLPCTSRESQTNPSQETKSFSISSGKQRG